MFILYPTSNDEESLIEDTFTYVEKNGTADSTMATLAEMTMFDVVNFDNRDWSVEEDKKYLRNEDISI